MFVIATGLTAGKGTDVRGRPQKDVTFAEMLAKTKEVCARFGYPMLIYDLGGAGEGIPLDTGSESFDQRGFYGPWKGGPEGWVSVAQHKPKLVTAALTSISTAYALYPPDTTLVYIDADVVLRGPLEELDRFKHFDMALCVRREKKSRPNVGFLNAGVMFFRNRPGTWNFIFRWKEMVEQQQLDDQFVVNKLCRALKRRPKPNTVEFSPLGGQDRTRIRMVDCWQYNNFYFDKWGKEVPHGVRLVHFKQDLRSQFRRWEGKL